MRNRSVARGVDAHPDEQPVEFSRTALYQTVLLPSGSSDGTYDVRIAAALGETVLTAGSEAKLNEGVTSLQSVASLSAGDLANICCKFGKRGWSVLR